MSTHEVSPAKRAHGKKMWQKNRVAMAIGVLKALPEAERAEVIQAVQCSRAKSPAKKAHRSKAALSPVRKSHK